MSDLASRMASLWDFGDPAGSEQRFRTAADAAGAAERAVLLTQVARALGLQDRFAEAQALLGEIEPVNNEVAVRTGLERGRALRSAGQPEAARPLFEQAADRAASAGLDALHVDALHMVALVADPGEQVQIGHHALAVARASSDPRARDWDASLLNNIGMAHADSGDFDRALGCFEEALLARRRIGAPADIRVARWMVAWALRNLGRRDEALAIQRALRTELTAAGEADPFVDEEITLLEQ